MKQRHILQEGAYQHTGIRRETADKLKATTNKCIIFLILYRAMW